MSAGKSKPAPMPYFDNLPGGALPALQAAWDKAMEKFSMTAIFDSFSRDMNELKYVAPTRPECNDWVNAVRSGRVERPTALAGGAEAEALAPPPTPETGHVAAVPLVADEDVGALLPEPAYVPLTPANFREFAQGGVIVPETARISFTPAADPAPVSAEVATRLRSFRSQLVADTCAILEADIRRQAEKIVIDQLRAMADEMEGGAM